MASLNGNPYHWIAHFKDVYNKKIMVKIRGAVLHNSYQKAAHPNLNNAYHFLGFLSVGHLDNFSTGFTGQIYLSTVDYHISYLTDHKISHFGSRDKVSYYTKRTYFNNIKLYMYKR